MRRAAPHWSAVLSILSLASTTISLRRALAFTNHNCQLARHVRSSHRFSDLSASDDASLSSWEQVYEEGGAAEMSNNGEISTELMLRSEIKVITFDLDNTLWNTNACIDAANEALAAHLEADDFQQPQRVEKVMGKLFQSDKPRYCPLDHETAKAPVLLTQLRIDAIRHVCEQHNGFSAADALEYAQTAFEVWTQARHDAIPKNLAKSVLQCLKRVSSLITSEGHPVLIGAITDGNSDPRRVEELRGYFDFCINAESVGVAKPDKRVYMEAVKHVAGHPSFANLKDQIENEEKLEDSIGPYWVHIGDDFVKDIVAAKSLKMRSVWATELIRDKLDANKGAKAVETKNSATLSDSDVKGFVKEISNKSVVEMAIGADSYLAESMTQEFVDARIEEFQDLADVLLGWHEEGQSASSTPSRSPAEPDFEEASRDLKRLSNGSEKKVNGDDTGDFLSVVVPEKISSSKPVTDDASIAKPRAFRIRRDDCSMDIPAPRRNREEVTMKEIMSLAQRDKSSGVFAFPAEDVQAMQKGSMALMVHVGGTDLQFTREVFSAMSTEEVLLLTDDNPVTLSLSMKEAVVTESFDLF